MYVTNRDIVVHMALVAVPIVLGDFLEPQALQVERPVAPVAQNCFLHVIHSANDTIWVIEGLRVVVVGHTVEGLRVVVGLVPMDALLLLHLRELSGGGHKTKCSLQYQF
jgi:hypothetical protein